MWLAMTEGDSTVVPRAPNAKRIATSAPALKVASATRVYADGVQACNSLVSDPHMHGPAVEGAAHRTGVSSPSMHVPAAHQPVIMQRCLQRAGARDDARKVVPSLPRTSIMAVAHNCSGLMWSPLIALAQSTATSTADMGQLLQLLPSDSSGCSTDTACPSKVACSLKCCLCCCAARSSTATSCCCCHSSFAVLVFITQV